MAVIYGHKEVIHKIASFGAPKIYSRNTKALMEKNYVIEMLLIMMYSKPLDDLL
jgi:hypothetical protein